MARSWADVGVRTQLADRQHVRVRPVSGLCILSPTCRVLELVFYADGEVRVGNAVNLQEIDTPGCVLTKERVVPRLAGGGALDSPACGVPRAGVILVGGILSFES